MRRVPFFVRGQSSRFDTLRCCTRIQCLLYVTQICRGCELLYVAGACVVFSTHAVQGSGSRGCGHLTTGAVSWFSSGFTLVQVNTLFYDTSLFFFLVISEPMFTNRRCHCNSFDDHMLGSCLERGWITNNLWLAVPPPPPTLTFDLHLSPVALWQKFCWHAPMVLMRPGCLPVPCTSSETVPATFKSGPPHPARREAESPWVDLDIPCFVQILFKDCTYFRGHQPHVSPLCAIWFTACIFSLWYSQRRYSCQITCEDDSCVLSLPLMSCRSACISWLPRPLPFMTILYSIICKDSQHAPISDLTPSISIINICIFSLKQMDLYRGLPAATT